MVKTVQQLRDAKKAFNLPTTHKEMETPSTCTSDENDGATNHWKVDGKLKSVVDSLTERMWEPQHDSDVSKLDQFIGWLDRNRKRFERNNHYSRSSREWKYDLGKETNFGWC